MKTEYDKILRYKILKFISHVTPVSFPRNDYLIFINKFYIFFCVNILFEIFTFFSNLCLYYLSMPKVHRELNLTLCDLTFNTQGNDISLPKDNYQVRTCCLTYKTILN